MYVVFKNIKTWFNDDEKLKNRFEKTYQFIYEAAHSYAVKLNDVAKSKTGKETGIQFSETLLKQSLIDAYDDLKRLTNYHPTDEPNPIKEMAYIVFWLMKHKPIRLLSEDIIFDARLTNIARTRYLFINENFGVKLLINAAFEGQKQKSECKHMEDFANTQVKYYKKFLLYYLVYRLESAKALEAMLLGCTIHPVWEVNPIIWETPIVSEEDF